MNIRKIYVRKVHLESLAENDCQLGANIPVGKKPFPMEEDNCVEYTNLSDAWHDAIEEKQPQKVCGNNPVLVQQTGKRWKDEKEVYKKTRRTIRCYTMERT